MQARWLSNREFEVDAPARGEPLQPKYMCTFPYPYMNGRLHLGHAFTVTKAEFAAGFHRLKGKRVMFPFGFHCTGMPIQAAANKLKREIETGAIHHPVAEVVAPEDAAAATTTPAGGAGVESKPKELGKFVGKKTKAAAKVGTGNTQYEIMVKNGIAEEDIPPFKESSHWLAYFPPLGKVGSVVRCCQAACVAKDWCVVRHSKGLE